MTRFPALKFGVMRNVIAGFVLASVCGASLAKTHVLKTGHGASPTAAADTAKADNDPLLAAMQQELAREKELLILPGMQRPYFMEYRLEDTHNNKDGGNCGSLTDESHLG